MLHKPIDEMSLRHLFSTNYASQILKLYYLGPVLGSNNSIIPSPDCLIVDKRNHPYRERRCEFKYQPSNIKDFEHNGNFDIAIIWDLGQGLDRERLTRELREQNRCEELIILTDFTQFRNLPEYSRWDISNYMAVDKMVDFLLDREPYVTFSAYLICGVYPNFFNSEILVEILSDNFSSIRDSSGAARANRILCFLQAEPQIIEKKYNRVYMWNNYYEPTKSLNKIQELMITNFSMNIPSQDLVNRIRIVPSL